VLETLIVDNPGNKTWKSRDVQNKSRDVSNITITFMERCTSYRKLYPTNVPPTVLSECNEEHGVRRLPSRVTHETTQGYPVPKNTTTQHRHDFDQTMFHLNAVLRKAGRPSQQ